MKTLLLALTLLAGCAPGWIWTKGPAWQCRHWVCPAAAIHENAGSTNDGVYDDIDNTCICRFRDGSIYTTPRR